MRIRRWGWRWQRPWSRLRVGWWRGVNTVRRVSAETDGEQQNRRGPSLTALATRACARGLVVPQAVRIDCDIGHAGIADFHLERPAQHRKASRFIRNRHGKESKNYQGARNDADHRYPRVSNGGAQLSGLLGWFPSCRKPLYVQTADHRAARAPNAPHRGRSASRSMPTSTARSVQSSSQSIRSSVVPLIT
jgi:hypothetical protein